MAQPRQRRPEQQGPQETPQQLIDRIKQSWERLQTLHLTPAQQTDLRRVIESMQTAPQTSASPPAPSAPRATQIPAPRRVQQFVYNVTVDSKTYELTLDQRLPTDSRGNLDMQAARRRLNDALLNNEPVALNAQRGTMNASVRMAGNSSEATTFNAGPENQKMDIFRDRYLNQSYRNGQYVENNPITIAQVQNIPRGG